MQAETKTIGDYMIGRTIGKGTFGKVKIGIHKQTKESVAIKILEKSRLRDKEERLRIDRQIDIMRRIRHPNIIQLYEIIETPTKVFLITEYAENGELFECIIRQDRLDDQEASRILQQLLNAVEYLHLLGICHRDIKPQNLLLDFQGNIKVVDFGLSNIYQGDDELKTACGSPCYASPEMISGLTYDGLSTDLWSCGIVLFAMLCGHLPFEDPDIRALYKKIRNGQFYIPKSVSNKASDLLAKMLQTDPKTRPTINQIRSHIFCQSFKQPLVSGYIPGGHYPSPQRNIAKQLSSLSFDVQNLNQDLDNNKHNRTTAAYYLLLKGGLRDEGKTVLDYFKKIEIQSRNLKRIQQQTKRTSLIRKGYKKSELKNSALQNGSQSQNQLIGSLTLPRVSRNTIVQMNKSSVKQSKSTYSKRNAADIYGTSNKDKNNKYFAQKVNEQQRDRKVNRAVSLMRNNYKKKIDK